MLRRLARNLLASSLGMATLLGGFWLLYLAFLHSSVVSGVVGGLMVPLGMRLIVLARGRGVRQER